MAKELAELTGQSITGAVTEAIRYRLEMLKGGSVEERAQRLLAIASDCARHLDEPTRKLDHGELLYDGA